MALVPPQRNSVPSLPTIALPSSEPVPGPWSVGGEVLMVDVDHAAGSGAGAAGVAEATAYSSDSRATRSIMSRSGTAASSLGVAGPRIAAEHLPVDAGDHLAGQRG